MAIKALSPRPTRSTRIMDLAERLGPKIGHKRPDGHSLNTETMRVLKTRPECDLPGLVMPLKITRFTSLKSFERGQKSSVVHVFIASVDIPENAELEPFDQIDPISFFYNQTTRFGFMFLRETEPEIFGISVIMIKNIDTFNSLNMPTFSVMFSDGALKEDYARLYPSLKALSFPGYAEEDIFHAVVLMAFERFIQAKPLSEYSVTDQSDPTSRFASWFFFGTHDERQIETLLRTLQ